MKKLSTLINGSFDEQAYAYADMCRLSYWYREGGWKKVVAYLKRNGAVKVSKIINKKTDTQILVVETKNKQIIIPRGTEIKSKKDIKTDLDLYSMQWFWKRKDKKKTAEIKKLKKEMKRAGIGRVHFGVWKATISIINDVLKKSNHGKEIVLAGHSLGNMIANCLAVLLELWGIDTVWGYGGARMGNLRFARTFKRLVKRSFQFVNNNDIVPKSVLVILGFWHVTGRYYITRKAKIRKGDIYIRDMGDRFMGRFNRVPGYEGSTDHSIQKTPGGYLERLAKNAGIKLKLDK